MRERSVKNGTGIKENIEIAAADRIGGGRNECGVDGVDSVLV